MDALPVKQTASSATTAFANWHSVGLAIGLVAGFFTQPY